MRRALWILSTPVVAGGLAWAVNAADDQAPLLARAPTSQNGKIHYFSRPDKSDAGATARETAVTDGSADEVDDSGVPQKYSRKRGGTESAAKSKNYYQDLFGEGTAPKATAAKKPTTANPAAAKATVSRKLDKRTPAADSLMDEASPDGSGGKVRESNLLPPSGSDLELAGGTEAEDAGIRHADHRERPGSRNSMVEQVQNRVKSPPVKSRAQAASAEAALPEPASDELDAPAPPPPSTTKPAKGAATRSPVTANKGARTNPLAKSGQPQTRSAAKPVVTAAAPKARVVPKAEAKVEKTEEDTATLAVHEETPVHAAPSSIQQVSAVTSTEAGDTPMISLHWVKRGEVNVGQECKCGLVVKNTGRMAAKDIVVEAYFPRTVRLLDAEPFPSDSKEKLSWVFEHLGAGEEKTIEITMIPGRRGELATSATVRFTGVASTVLQVEEPQLALSLTGSKEVMVGETLTQLITVSNPGTGVAHDVVVHAKVPEGLEHPKGSDVELGIGSLGTGESREIRLPMAAVTGGQVLLQVEARGSNLVQKMQAEITIAAPKLKVELAGPGLRYVNRQAQYTITVTNEGVASTDNVRVVHLVPEGFDFVKADRGGKFDAGSSSVSWYVGRVEAGQAVQLAVDLNAKQIGDHKHHVQASGESGSVAAAKLDTRVDGSAAIVMEVADIDDPVEIETQTAYEIRIRNDGTKAAQNLRLACELPQGVELIGTEGPTDHVMDKGVLAFRPLAELPAGTKITYRVKVNGKVAGNLRCRAKLTSNATTEPLIVEELTKFYGD